MNAPALHAVDNNDKTDIERLLETLPAAPAVVKTLDSKFESLGDALFTWFNSDGYESRHEKSFDGSMCRAFCRALNLPFSGIKSDALLTAAHYFESDAWVFDYLEAKGFHRLGDADFFLMDEYNRPVVHVVLSKSTERNISISMVGIESEVVAFVEELKKHVKLDPVVEKKTTYLEVVPGGRGMMSLMGGGGGDGLTLESGTIDNPRVAHDAYYPYIEGGIEALIRDFIESNETVLIFKGKPGTGKTSAIAAGVDLLGLLPIYAKKAEVVHNKDFIGFVFKSSDTYMAKVAGTNARARSELFVESTLEDREFAHNKKLGEEEKKEEPRIPVIVVEDADNLLAPRSTGNPLMAELLNETDGIGSNHTRKIIFTTNLSNDSDIDEALMRAGRCYGVVEFRHLTPAEAVVAREAYGLPPFETMPTKDISLAEALRKPRKRISVSGGKARLGFSA